MVSFSRNLWGTVLFHVLTFHSLLSNALSISAASLNNTYDYVIVGGGLSGLVVANRLTEDPEVTVLVIEYGHVDNSSTTLIPYNANQLNIADMFNLTSAPIPGLNNKTSPVWVGAVVGGGTIVNGMEYDRASKSDYDAWESLGNPGWGWSGLLPYFKKSTTFTPPAQDFADQFGITWDITAYGDGPLQASIPPFLYPELPTFWSAWNELDVPHPEDGAIGDIGVFWSPSSLDPKTQTRSSSRTAYYDPISARPNLHLLTGHRATEILFENLTAYSVLMESRNDGSIYAANATKEVILAAGAIYTPQLLMLSGIGPREELEAANLSTKLDLPGVGANFQDHPVAYLNFNLTKDIDFPNPSSLTINSTYNESSYQQYLLNRTGPYTAAHGNSVAFLPLPLITSNSSNIVNDYQSQQVLDFLPSSYASRPELIAGYKAQKAILLQRFASNDSAVHELPFNGGSSTPAALQKPVSRGTIALSRTDPRGDVPSVRYNVRSPGDGSGNPKTVITPQSLDDSYRGSPGNQNRRSPGDGSGNPNAVTGPQSLHESDGAPPKVKHNARSPVDFVNDSPTVNYNTLQNPVDAAIFVAMVRYTRKFFGTEAMRRLGPVETAPGAQAETDDEILSALQAGILTPSFAHPSCSCAMMPRHLGGVVNPELLVYGTQRLSIVDASIMPMIVGAHLQETMYAVAEKAADIIKGRSS